MQMFSNIQALRIIIWKAFVGWGPSWDLLGPRWPDLEHLTANPGSFSEPVPSLFDFLAMKVNWKDHGWGCASHKIAYIVGHWVVTWTWRQVQGAETSIQPRARAVVNIAVYGAEPDHLPCGGDLFRSWRVQFLWSEFKKGLPFTEALWMTAAGPGLRLLHHAYLVGRLDNMAVKTTVPAATTDLSHCVHSQGSHPAVRPWQSFSHHCIIHDTSGWPESSGCLVLRMRQRMVL
jgi:hypothetical protein